MLALIAAIATVSASLAMVLSTDRAYHITAPPSLCECLLAYLLVIEMLDHRDN